MAFTKSYRLERVYFERLKSMIDILKPYLNEETDEKLKAILENSIDDNGAILLLYRNLGEAWAELSDLIKKADEKIDQTKEEAEKYHDELNERIDEVNNYIMAQIRTLEACCEEVHEALENKQDKIIVHFTPMTGNPGNYECDKTFKEMYNAINSGSDVVGYVYTPPTQTTGNAPLYYVVRIKSNYLSIKDHLDDEEEPYYAEDGLIVFSSEALNQTYLPTYYNECTIFVIYSKYVEDGETSEEEEYTGVITTESRTYTLFKEGPAQSVTLTNEEASRIIAEYRNSLIAIIVSQTVQIGKPIELVYRFAYCYETVSDATYGHYCFTCPDFTSGSLVTHVMEMIHNVQTSEITISAYDI